MALNTYTELVAKLQTWLNTTESNFVATLDEIINLAELRVQRDLELEGLKKNATGTLTQSSRNLSLPADYIKPAGLSITVSGSLVPLMRRTKEFVDYYAPATATEGQPKFWAVDDEDSVYLAPTPDSNYAYTFRYLARIAPLVSSSNETNWLTDNVYDLLFAAACYECQLFLDDPEEADRYLAKYLALLAPAQIQYIGETRIRYQRIKPAPRIEERD